MGLKDLLNKLFKSGEETSKKVEDITKEGLDKAGEYTEKVGREFMERSKPIVDKFQDTSEEIGKTILEKGKKFSSKAEDFTESIGRKILDAKEDAMKTMRGEGLQRNPSETTSDINDSDTFNPLFEDEPKRHHADETEPKEPFVPKEDPFAKYEDSHLKKSHMDALKDTPGFGSSSSFFEKAEKFANRDYDGVKENQILEDSSTEPKEEKKPWTDPVAGFEDLDGDGDPVIDDAIIEEE